MSMQHSQCLFLVLPYHLGKLGVGSPPAAHTCPCQMAMQLSAPLSRGGCHCRTCPNSHCPGHELAELRLPALHRHNVLWPTVQSTLEFYRHVITLHISPFVRTKLELYHAGSSHLRYRRPLVFRCGPLVLHSRWPLGGGKIAQLRQFVSLWCVRRPWRQPLLPRGPVFLEAILAAGLPGEPVLSARSVFRAVGESSKMHH